MDVLLHLELQKSAKIRADIEKELEDVVSVVDAFEMYKAKGSGGVPFAQYLKAHETGLAREINPTYDRREIMSRRYDQAQVSTTVTPSLSSMSTLLNRLKTIDMGDS
jgi:hypothetical protein